MKQQLQTYLEKERENQEAADKQAARQTELMKEIAELKQQLETERGDVGKLREDINTLTLERDACKRKVEELEMQPEESKVGIVIVKNLLRALSVSTGKREKTNILLLVLADCQLLLRCFTMQNVHKRHIQFYCFDTFSYLFIVNRVAFQIMCNKGIHCQVLIDTLDRCLKFSKF